jgi:hypothetical protein
MLQSNIRSVVSIYSGEADENDNLGLKEGQLLSEVLLQGLDPASQLIKFHYDPSNLLGIVASESGLKDFATQLLDEVCRKREADGVCIVLNSANGVATKLTVITRLQKNAQSFFYHTAFVALSCYR